MKKLFCCLLFTISLFLLNVTNVSAFSSTDYSNRELCGNFEVAGFHSDGVIDTVGCHNTYEEARDEMRKNGADDLAIMTKMNGVTKILDANVGLLDMNVHPGVLTNFYRNSDLKEQLTYMDNRSSFGGVDGALLEIAYNPQRGWVAKVRIGNTDSWISSGDYEIVPITWVKSTSTYTVTSESIRHNYVAKIQEPYYGSAGSTIGPKPEMLDAGTYYSYDGHYFYKDLKSMIVDYRNGTYENSVNKDKPYYNYYMYLSNRTKTTYSGLNIDEYIRNNMGIVKDVYGNASSNGSSRLYGKGQMFYNAQERYGVNALLSLSLSRNETGNGRSKLAIDKNNGFGLDAVDSNPINGARSYSTFSNSIMGYASWWISMRYAHPRAWHYFGPQFGDKGTGMNVKYASDTYWSEKMASNYYNLDKAKGLQDYNYYQLGVVTQAVNAMSDARGNSKHVYTYPEAEDAVVIIGEKQGEEVLGNTTWYKLVSDLNIDANFNEITGEYNWDSYVYVPAAYVRKINTGKNGYVSPNEVTEYIDKDYTYDLYDIDGVLTPKVAITTKESEYYYDSALQSKMGLKVLKDKYVMVYACAYDGDKNPVSYLITSDYKFDQKEWVSADSLNFIESDYGKVSVTVSGNQYTWVNSVPEDTKETLISGQYTNSYVPVLEKKSVNGLLWYKVPVNLTGTNNAYGWTLASAPGVVINLSTTTVENSAPEIKAFDKTIVQGTKIDLKKDVTATDKEDGDLTEKIIIASSNLKEDVVGVYEVVYSVTDSKNKTVTKTIKITVTENKKPVITATDKTITQGTKFDINEDVVATDEEDGTLEVEVIQSNLNIDRIGTYAITYKATDSFNQSVTKTIKVTVVENQLPTITATDKTIYLNEKFDAKVGVKATDPEDGDITEKIKVIKDTVNPTKVGEYIVVYEVVDSYNNCVIKEIKVTVMEKSLEEKDGIFYFYYLKSTLGKLKLQGYQTIYGIDNNLNTEINYKIILKNIETDEEIEVDASRITKEEDIPKKVYSPDGKDYTYSWFNATIDIDKLKPGNYKMYIEASTKDYYSKSIINNKTYNKQITNIKSRINSAIINNNYDTQTSFVELKVRKDLLAEKNGSYVYNQYDKYTKFEFNSDNTLHLRGTSYSYEANLGKDTSVSRKIIFENKTTYKTYVKDLGSITTGNYNVVLPVSDNLDKTRAWYDNNIDISDIEKGEYVIYITTSSNITDISEMTEKLGRNLDSVKATINDKKYSFTINKQRGNRIEMKVE